MPTCEGFGVFDYGWFGERELSELNQMGHCEAGAELERRLPGANTTNGAELR
jgi:hypothetical protein